MNKILVLYYSRTGTTKKVAIELAQMLGAEVEEIVDTKNRAGAIGYLTAGRDAATKKLTKLESLKVNLSSYDLVIIGTPLWAWTVSAPIRTLLVEQKSNLKAVAFFCTRGGAGNDNVFSEMSAIIDKSSIASLSLLTKEVVQNNFKPAVESFVEKIKSTL